MGLNKPLLSILIPSIPERLTQLNELLNYYSHLITDEVEILSFCDNKKRTIGHKRNDLLHLAQGTYITFSDDDDRFTPEYFTEVLEVIKNSTIPPHVITYKQHARIDEAESKVVFRLGATNEDFLPGGITNRKAWHCCTWRKDVIKHIKFGNKNWGEDSIWADKTNKKAQTEIFIDKILHIYEHDSHKTAAFQ